MLTWIVAEGNIRIASGSWQPRQATTYSVSGILSFCTTMGSNLGVSGEAAASLLLVFFAFYSKFERSHQYGYSGVVGGHFGRHTASNFTPRKSRGL